MSDTGNPARNTGLPDWIDRLRAADPGTVRLRLAAQVVVTILAAMAAEYLLVRLTGGLAVVALMLGAVVGLCGVFAAPMFSGTRQTVLNLALIPIPTVAGLAVGLALAPWRIWGFVAIVVVLTAGAYLRRYGPRGFFGGNFAFIGTFFGLFLHGVIDLSSIGRLTVQVCVGVAVTIALQATVFRADDRRTLRRLRRAFGLRARGVASVALELADRPGDQKLVKLLQRRLLRFNETALMVDAYLAAVGGAAVHQRLFDLELAVTNLARFTVTLSATELPAPVGKAVRDGLAAVGELDPERAAAAGTTLLAALDVLGEDPKGLADPRTAILAHRFGVSLAGFAEAVTALRAAADGRPEQAEFAAAATLVGGWLPGSATVSATASEEAPTRPGDRWAVAPYVRVAVQMGVAVTVALVLGDLLDPKRYYWAVIAAFVTFMGAHNAGEQLRKGSLRLLGTVAGVLAGALLAHLVGPSLVAALAVMLIALFIGMYLMRSSYAWFVVAITIAVSQLYVQLGEYSDDLLLLRLAETAIGAGTALLTVLLVVPLRTGRVVRVATREYLVALGELTETAAGRLLGRTDLPSVRASARRLDAAYQALMATMAARGVPLLPPPSERVQFVNALTASRNYARNLLADADSGQEFSSSQGEALTVATGTLRDSIAELVAALNGEQNKVYVRSASLYDTLAVALTLPVTDPAQLALRDFQLIDGSLATVAAILGLDIVSLDEAPA